MLADELNFSAKYWIRAILFQSFVVRELSHALNDDVNHDLVG